METIICRYCKKSFEISQALADQMSEEEKRHREEEILQARGEERKRAEQKLREEIQLKQKDYENQLREDKEQHDKLVQDILKANAENRTLRKKDEERELETQKKLQSMEEKIKEDVTKKETERIQLILAEKDKQMDDMKKALDEARRKSEQGSQQLQGEVLELELEDMLRNAFPHDDVEAIGKGISGADIKQIVKSPLGNTCGIILWESKRTKHWEDKWIGKLKDDERREGAHVSVIVSVELPKDITNGLGVKNKVWICKSTLTIPLAQLLREKLYEVAREKARNTNSTEPAALVYQYITSHEFQQQVESMMETYRSMREQLQKEKAAFERIWKIREGQIDRLIKGVTNIYASIEGKGVSMQTIKGLEPLELMDGE